MKIFTIGYTQKSAEQFFELLHEHHIQRVIDIRVNPNGQLAGFAQKRDLPYFLHALADRCDYLHLPQLAPTKELLKEYHDNRDWERYEQRFIALMEERHIPESLNHADFEDKSVCLLCSEHEPKQCHRRLVAERLAKRWREVEVIHL